MRIESAEQLEGQLGVQAVLLADTDALIATLTTVADNRAGTELHVHQRHADCFLVLSGALHLRLADGEQIVEAGSWAQVPQCVVHAYTPAATGARFLNVHAPACGFGAYVRALSGEGDLEATRAAFDQQPASAGVAAATKVVVSRLGGAGGETMIDTPDRRVTLLADTPELSVVESVYRHRTDDEHLHIHRDHTTAWLVLEGELTFTLRNELTLVAAAGTFVSVPPGVVHGVASTSDVPVRFLSLHAPGCGFGDFLRGRNPGFDQHLQRDGGVDPATVSVRYIEL